MPKCKHNWQYIPTPSGWDEKEFVAVFVCPKCELIKYVTIGSKEE